jgi:hypothetical protein
LYIKLHLAKHALKTKFQQKQYTKQTNITETELSPNPQEPIYPQQTTFYHERQTRRLPKNTPLKGEKEGPAPNSKLGRESSLPSFLNSSQLWCHFLKSWLEMKIH